MLQIMFLVSLESSQQGGVHGLGSARVQKFLNTEWCFQWNLIKSQLKISEELECAFGVGGKILMSKI
jgi:hypothetical protein